MYFITPPRAVKADDRKPGMRLFLLQVLCVISRAGATRVFSRTASLATISPAVKNSSSNFGPWVNLAAEHIDSIVAW